MSHFEKVISFGQLVRNKSRDFVYKSWLYLWEKSYQDRCWKSVCISSQLTFTVLRPFSFETWVAFASVTPWHIETCRISCAICCFAFINIWKGRAKAHKTERSEDIMKQRATEACTADYLIKVRFAIVCFRRIIINKKFKKNNNNYFFYYFYLFFL